MNSKIVQLVPMVHYALENQRFLALHEDGSLSVVTYHEGRVYMESVWENR